MLIHGASRSTVTALRTVLLLACAGILVAGCSHFTSGNTTADFPQAEQFPHVYQGKLMAAAHWKIIAENEADLLAARFAPDSSFTVAADDPRHASPNGSRFGVAYQHMLTAGLLSNGMRVFDSAGDFRLSYHLAVVEHQPRTQRNTPAGFFSGALAGAYLLATVAERAVEPALALVPLAAAADIYSYSNSDTETPNTEIVLTTAARREDQVVYSNSSVYYLRAVDRELYDACEGPGCRDYSRPENRGDDTPRFPVERLPVPL